MGHGGTRFIIRSELFTSREDDAVDRNRRRASYARREPVVVAVGGARGARGTHGCEGRREGPELASDL